MACQITYNDNNTISVAAPNGQPSVLFETIKQIPGIESEDQALESWLKVYTNKFKEWFGKDWENISEKEKEQLTKDGYLDINGEPAIFYRGDYENLQEFNYSPTVGKFGQGIYLTSTLTQAESFAAKTGKQVYPVFLKPGKSVSFKGVTQFDQATAKFNNKNTVPTEEDRKAYVEALHNEDTTIIGNGIMGREYNVPNSGYAKSIFTKGFELYSGLLFDNSFDKELVNEETQESVKSDRFVEELAYRLAKNLGMEGQYLQIGKDEASFITRNAKNPWKGQPAFFFEGKVYFVEGQLNYTTAIHEFGHAFVRAISKDNPALFNKLFQEAIGESKGKQFLAEALEEYGELTGQDDQVKEEVIVKLMTDYSKNQFSSDPSLAPLGKIPKIIDKIIYAIKQILRKISGKSNLKNLSVDTSVKDLAGMIMDKTWDVNLDIVSDETMVSYIHDLKTQTDSLQKLAKSQEGRAGVYNMIVENSTVVRKQLEEMKKTGRYEDLAIVLSDTSGRMTFEQMRATINSTLNTKEKTNKALAEELDSRVEFEKRINALALNLIYIDDTVNKMKDHIDILVDEPNQKEALRKLDFYVKSMDQWKIYLNNFLSMAEENNIPMNSAIIADIREIRGNIETGQEQVRSIYKKALSEALTEVFQSTNDKIGAKKDAQINKIKKQLVGLAPGSSSAIEKEAKIKQLEEEKAKLMVDEKKMLDYLTGKMGDIGWVHANFENFISNQDPSISSFAKYIKTHISQVQTKVHNKYSEFVNEINPLIKQLGIKPSELNKFAKEFLFADTAYKRNEQGEIEEMKVHTFLNEYKNYKFSIAKINQDLNDADIMYESNPSAENLARLEKLQNLKDNHMKLFFKKRYVDEYYHADDILDNHPLGAKAKLLIENKMSDIKTYQTSHMDSAEVYEDYQTAEYLWREYKQLFSTYDNYGKKKEGEELEIAELLQKWREAKRKFHYYDLNPGAFQGAMKQMEVKLVAKMQDEGYRENTPEFEEEFERRRDIWIRANTQVKIKDAFYDERKAITDRISEILLIARQKQLDTVKARLAVISPESDEAKRLQPELKRLSSDVSEIEMILDSLQGRRDVDGQPIGTEMSEEHLALIKDTEEWLNTAKEDIAGVSGLSPKEWARMSYYYEQFEYKVPLTPEELKDYKRLKNRKSKMGISKTLREELRILYEELSKIQHRQATTYYIDIVNQYYHDIMKAKGEEVPNEIGLHNIDDFSDPEFVNPLLDASPEFRKWFEANHIYKQNYVGKNGEGVVINSWQRTYAWSIIRPNDPKYMEKTDITDESGEVIESIPGVPNIKFQQRRVKPEYHTGYNKETGEVDHEAYVDASGSALPKNLEEMEEIREKYADQLDNHNKELEEYFGQKFAWDHYINREYYDLKEKGGVRFELLEKLKEFHMNAQEGLERYTRLGYELPRFRKDRYEYLTSATAQGVGDKIKEIKTGIAQTFGKKADDAEEGLNYDAQMALINVDMYAGEESKIPIRGTYALDYNQVSQDITSSLFMYYQSAEQNKILREMQPMAKAMQELANENPKDLKKLNKMAYMTRNAKEYITGRTNNRKAVIDGMVEMLFEGKKLKEGFNNNATTNKIIKNMLGMASHSFFAFDITSALKNFLGARFNIAIESIGGKHFSYRSWQSGKPWALKTMSEISGQIYSNTAKSTNVQIVEIFDAIQGRFQDKFGESLSRSFARDVVGGTWTTSHRKWLETEATLQLFSALMHETKVDMQMPDGTTKKIPYTQAWELDEKGRITLKAGIDKIWDINGEKFNEIKFKNHEISNFLQGAYAEMDQPLITRNMGFRMISSMKKYFTKMLLHRYGAKNIGWMKGGVLLGAEERYNTALGETHLGYYWQNLMTLQEAFKTRGRSLLYMSKDQTAALKSGAAEILRLQLFVLAYMWFFGFDPDDPDKWKKIKARSGALPSVFTDEEWAKGFNVPGWLMNHGLLTAMNAEAEYRHFIPVPGYGFKDMYDVVLGDASVSAMGSTGLLLNMTSSLYFNMTGNDVAIYKTSGGSGALNVMQEGESKFWVDFYKSIGIKNKFIDPATAIKNYHQISQNYRR